MDATFNYTMRAGTISDLEKIVGWCLSKTTTRQWIARPLPKDAVRRICRDGAFAWARPYIIENGMRVVLA
jgi:hypothetical protein